MTLDKPIVHHWRAESGEPESVPDWMKHIYPSGFRETVPKGWYCWFYAPKSVDIDKWMKNNMAGNYDCTFRFNSGDPMHTIFIQSDEDATFFKVAWM